MSGREKGGYSGEVRAFRIRLTRIHFLPHSGGDLSMKSQFSLLPAGGAGLDVKMDMGIPLALGRNVVGSLPAGRAAREGGKAAGGELREGLNIAAGTKVWKSVSLGFRITFDDTWVTSRSGTFGSLIMCCPEQVSHDTTVRGSRSWLCSCEST